MNSMLVGKLKCTDCDSMVPDPDQVGEGKFSNGSRCEFIDCEGIYLDPTKPRRWYVNVYELDRAFGGREEGDWWYDTGTPVDYYEVCFTEAFAWFRARKLAAEKYLYDGLLLSKINYHGGCYEVKVQTHPAKAFPETRPHYE
ncbi:MULTISPECIES: hypothetical protein [Streptomyces]|uniref:hypothetical protein n=1 Tax=Streptomyces TaxID=1883 RepID=UPI003669D046